MAQQLFADRSAEAHARYTTYGFLAWLFLKNPDAAFLQQLLAGGEVSPQAASDEQLGGPVGEALQQMRGFLAGRASRPIEETCQELAVQRTRLFRGIAPGYGPRPPYEAAYRSPQDGSEPEILLAVQSFYREAGADLPEDYAERLDYLGIELDLMRFLCSEEQRQWEAGDAESAARYRTIQRRFLREHLLPWVPRFCDAILKEPGVPFYWGVAQLLTAFLADEDAEL